MGNLRLDDSTPGLITHLRGFTRYLNQEWDASQVSHLSRQVLMLGLSMQFQHSWTSLYWRNSRWVLTKTDFLMYKTKSQFSKRILFCISICLFVCSFGFGFSLCMQAKGRGSLSNHKMCLLSVTTLWISWPVFCQYLCSGGASQKSWNHNILPFSQGWHPSYDTTWEAYE